MNTVGTASGLGRTRLRRIVQPGLAARAGTIGALLVVALFVLPLSGGDWVSTFTSVSIFAVVAASLGVLYGRAGMISLGQVALLELGVWIAAKFSYSTAIPFPIFVVCTGLITGVIGVVLGLPALRLSGLYLALVTLMFAGAVNVILSVTNFPNGGKGFLGHIAAGDLEGIKNVRRPGSAIGDTAYYRYVVVACAILFAVALVHVATKPGRAWAAIRESEPAALAAGVNVTFYKLWAFGLAAFMTGCAGALLAALQGQPTVYGFSTQDSLTALATALIGGIFSFWGAIVAGLFYSLLPFLFQAQLGWNTNFVTILFGFGLTMQLLTAPGGIASQILGALSRRSKEEQQHVAERTMQA